MMYQLKARFQFLAEKFSSSSMTANQATAFGFLFIFLTVAGFYYASELPFLLWINPLFIFFRFVMNALDGLLARRQKTASPAGEVMNEMSDVFGDILSYGIFYFLFPEFRTQLVILLLAIWFCEFSAVLGKSLPKGHRRQESAGGGKPERALFLVLISWGWALSKSWMDQYLGAIFIFISALVILSGLLRIKKSLTAAKGSEYQSQTLLGR